MPQLYHTDSFTDLKLEIGKLRYFESFIFNVLAEIIALNTSNRRFDCKDIGIRKLKFRASVKLLLYTYVTVVSVDFNISIYCAASI